MRGRWRRAAAAAALAVLAGGCWDFRGLEQRGFVTLLGIDRTGDGGYRVSIQLPLAGAGREPGGGIGGESGFRVLVGEGETLREGVEQVRADVVRELDASFLDAVVLGEGAAANLADLDFLARSLRVPVNTYVAVARGDAEPVVRASTPGFSDPGQALLHALSATWTRSPAVVPAYLWLVFNRNFFTPLEDPFAPALTAREYGLNVQGLAVFRGHRLAGFLDEEEASLFAFLRTNRFERTIATTRIPGRPGVRATVYVQHGKVRRRVTWEPGGPVLQVEAAVAGDLRELSGMRITRPDEQALVERALAAELEADLTRLIRRLQELGSDPAGFGELARRADPRRLRDQDGEKWHALYVRAPVRVSVRVRIISPGYMK